MPRGPGSWRRARASRCAICRSTPRMSKWPISATAKRRPISTSGATSATGAKSARDSTAPTALTRVRYGDPDLVEQQYNKGEYFFKFSYDRLDNVHFPRDGQTFTLQWDANRTNLGADIASDRVTADWLMARSRGRNTLLLWTSAGSTLDGDFKASDVAGILLLGRILQFVGPRAAVADRAALCDRARHLLPQDRPRRRGLVRISRLYRRVIGARQHLGAPRRHQLCDRRTRTRRYSWRSTPILGPSTWAPATIKTEPPRSICSSAGLFEALARRIYGVEATPPEEIGEAVRAEGRGRREYESEAARNCGFRRVSPPSRTPAPADRRSASIRACATCPRGPGRAPRR